MKSELASFLDIEEDDMFEEDDIVGYKIYDGFTGDYIGIIESVDSSTENLLFVVLTKDDEEVFIPAVDEFIEEIDDNDKIIKMRLPEGLVELNKKG